MHLSRLLPAFLLFAASLCAQTPPPPAADPFQEPPQKPRNFPALTPAELAAIDAATPARARVTPAIPRRLLVFNRTGGFVHASIPFGDEALRRLGEKTGAFSVTITDDIAAFAADNLAAFDAVVFNNTTLIAFKNPAYRRALLDFVASGKGIAGIHAATDNFPTWPEGQALIGGVFHGHPWNAGDVCAVKLDEPDHVINSAFDGSGFWIREEIYQIAGPYGRDRQRVLLSLDMSRPENARPPEKIKRTDNDFPISWIKTEGAGRVFYTSLGHNKDIFSTPELLQHLLDGLQFALGDLPADAVPSASLPSTPVPALAPDDKTPIQKRSSAARASAASAPSASAPAVASDPWADLATFTAQRQVDSGPRAVSRLLLALPAAERLVHEPRLLALLANTAAPLEARREALHLLLLTGSPAVVPALEKASTTAGLFPDAVMALSAFATPEAAAARLRLLASASSPAERAVVLNSLAARPVPAAIKPVAALATEPAPVGPAALSVLATLATRDALRALAKLPSSPATRSALLAASDRLLRQENSSANRRAAAKIATDLLKASATPVERLAAARLLLAAKGPAAASELLPLLSEPALATDLARALVLVADAKLFAKLSAAAPSLSAPALTALYSAAGERRSPAAVPLLTAGLARADAPARPAAALALGRCGDASASDLLFPLLTPAGPLADAARDALGQLPAPATDALLRARLTPAPAPEIHATLLRILAARRDRQAFALATAACSSTDAAVRAAAFEAVATLVRAGDLATVAALVPQVQKAADRREWRRALFNAVATEPDGATATRLLSAALAVPEPLERPALIGALTLIADPGATTALRTLLDDPDLESRKEVIRALSAARTEGAYTLLLAQTRRATDSGERILSLRGCLETLQSPDLFSSDSKLNGYREAWLLAERIEEKRAILDAVRKMNGKTAAAFVKEREADLKSVPKT